MPAAGDNPTPAMPGEVRYSLPEMLRELEADRASTSFAMEKLDQESITKLFEPNRTRRVRPHKPGTR